MAPLTCQDTRWPTSEFRGCLSRVRALGCTAGKESPGFHPSNGRGQYAKAACLPAQRTCRSHTPCSDSQTSCRTLPPSFGTSAKDDVSGMRTKPYRDWPSATSLSWLSELPDFGRTCASHSPASLPCVHGIFFALWRELRQDGEHDTCSTQGGCDTLYLMGLSLNAPNSVRCAGAYDSYSPIIQQHPYVYESRVLIRPR